MTENPSQVASHINPSAATALIGDPSKYGYVADDGTVYVRTPYGDKAVGSYPGKSADEALQYFVRKFESLASEVAILGARIRSNAMVPSDAYEAVNKLRQQIIDSNVVGDLETLHASLNQLPDIIEGNRAAYEAKKAMEKAEREARRADALIQKENIVNEAESLADSENWKSTGERLKELLEQWKAAPRLDKKSDAELWKRFSSARNRFDKKRRTHFANLDAQQKQVATTKRELVEKAEALATSTDWVATARAYKALMDKWKASGRGKPSDDAKLWERFKKAQDTFFTAKNADLEKREGTMQENLVKREALITRIEAILPITDLDRARKEFRELMAEWSKIGITDRNKRAALDARVDVVSNALKEAEAEKWRRSDPAAKARANDVVEQLTKAIAAYEEAATKAAAAGNTKKAQEARMAAEARRSWLSEAEKGLAEFN
ncbi:MAG: DUF349 domain-containing protein [Candidatus Nanopelagicaceae bacterium]